MQQVKEGRKWPSTGVPILNKQGDIVLTLCTSKDVTELVDLEKVEK